MGQSASVGAGTVNEASLEISNAGSNGQYLQKQSATTGGLTWAAVTSPAITAIAGTAANQILTDDGDATVTSESGLTFASNVLTVTGNVLPEANGTRDLGADGTRWQNIYTSDLHLTNERGSWTVIEEEDYLTLRNNKNDKVYKLVMEEIE
jgi:hypothetical protein